MRNSECLVSESRADKTVSRHAARPGMQRERVCMGTNAYRCARARVIVHRSAESEAPTDVLGTMLSAPLNSTDKQDPDIPPLAESFQLRPAFTAHDPPHHVVDWSQLHAAMRRRK
jgi:hypothetical protein